MARWDQSVTDSMTILKGAERIRLVEEERPCELLEA